MATTHSDALVFFGATGDLAYKQIFPGKCGSLAQHVRSIASKQRHHYEWLAIKAPSHIDPTLQLDDAGKAEAISLALELKADLLLADDRKLGSSQRSHCDGSYRRTGIGFLVVQSGARQLDAAVIQVRIRL